jgi:hypothetical protein
MIVKSVFLPLPRDAAFELFTQKIGQWWPADRRHTQDPASEIYLLASGRFYERARDGREVDLGRVRAWEFPERILLDFYVATGRDQPTEVEIAFAATAGGTNSRGMSCSPHWLRRRLNGIAYGNLRVTMRG